MKRIEYTKITDKSEWGDGPWSSEPDKIQWRDEATQLPCIIRRSPSSGGWCGYVGVSKDHPSYGKEYDDVDVDVHGGLTFANSCDGTELGVCHKVEPGEDDCVWWLGFDCGHFMDFSPAYMARQARRKLGLLSDSLYSEDMVYRDQAYVTAEVESLAKQLKGMAP